MNTVWEVFLSPHTDDEVLGMAGAITRAHRLGFRTLVVLVTDNIPSTRQSLIFPHENLADLRRAEWRKAMQCLHVDELQTWEISEHLMAEAPELAATMIQMRLTALLEEHNTLHVHSVIGAEDVHAYVGYGAQAHAVCADAVARFACLHHMKVSLHAIYVYSKPYPERIIIGTLPVIRDRLSLDEWEQKRNALRCYHESDNTIGYGYRSVPELFDNADIDPHEYVVDITGGTPV